MKNKTNGIDVFWITVIFALFCARGSSFGNELEPIWKKYIVASRHFSLQSPYPIVKAVQAAENGQVTFQNSPQVGNTQIFIIVTPRRGKSTLANITGEVLSSLEKREGYSKFESRMKKTTCSKYPAVLTKRTFEKNGNVSMGEKELDVVKGKAWYCVMVFYDFGNKELDRMADQVIHSFKILN